MRERIQLLPSFSDYPFEAGCDEAGRGCLAGPVFAAAVILPAEFSCPDINDSKQLTEKKRNELRSLIELNALAWAVASVDHETIDRINILQASYLAMHKAIKLLSHVPQMLLIDGNRFNPFPSIPHECFVKGDSRFMSIAAASILAKTHRDEYMQHIHNEHPQYGWKSNKGYPTVLHIEAMKRFGLSQYHRKSFRPKIQLRITFD